MSNYFHETAVIDDDVCIGDGCKVWHFSHVCSGAKIGSSVSLGQNVYVAGGAVIGNFCKIQNNVSLYDGVVLEDSVFCGPSAVFTNVINPRAEINKKNEYKKTFIRQGATIGANSTVICGVEVGSYSLIGAGAVVTVDVPAFALFLGVPGKVVGWVDQAGNIIERL